MESTWQRRVKEKEVGTGTVMQRLCAQIVLCLRHVQRVLACSGDGGAVEPGGHLRDALHSLYINQPLLSLRPGAGQGGAGGACGGAQKGRAGLCQA